MEISNAKLVSGSHTSEQSGHAVMLRLAEGLAFTKVCQAFEQKSHEVSARKRRHRAGPEAYSAQKSDILKAIRGESRGTSQTARARQRAMYLAHVAGGLSLTSVGAGFGRDRTTVRHACALWEDARDNKDVDAGLSCEEASLQAMVQMLKFNSACHSFDAGL